MRIRPFFFIILLNVLISCGNSGYDQEKSNQIDQLEEMTESELKEIPEDAPYGCETGIIEYESQVIGMKQQIITTFIDFGKISKTEIISKMLGQSIKQVILTSDTGIYNLNLIDSSGIYFSIDSTAKTDINFRTLNKEKMKELNITKTGSEVVLGKECDIYEFYEKEKDAQIKTWIWNGISIKTISTIGGLKVLMQAQKLRTNVKVSPKTFTLPEGFSIKKTVMDSLLP